MFPFTVVPAYHLPVYASQRPLPDATQDSVRGCLLGFAAAVIADGRLQRACKARRSRRALLTHRAPPSGSGVKAVTRQRVYGSDWRKEAGDELDEPLPAEACRLAAPLERCEPEPLRRRKSTAMPIGSPELELEMATATRQRRRTCVTISGTSIYL